MKKRNILNEIRANNMSIQELRFFNIYLSRINPYDVKTRVVRFAVADFQKIMGFSSRNKIYYLKSVANSLLCKVVNIPTKSGGYETFQLFEYCRIDLDDNDEWYIEINAHERALPLIFEFKERYSDYGLWNTLSLRLKSPNQLRMYEILKQYESIGGRIVSVNELKELLGINAKAYPRFGDFKTWVLDVCQKALEENTDIKFTYGPIGKRGKGGKILTLRFEIVKNEKYVD
jgi:plasmid replication initiation protein